MPPQHFQPLVGTQEQQFNHRSIANYPILWYSFLTVPDKKQEECQ